MIGFDVDIELKGRYHHPTKLTKVFLSVLSGGE
jgi:hypothetical protein